MTTTIDIRTALAAHDLTGAKSALARAELADIVAMLRELDGTDRALAFRLLSTVSAAAVYDQLTPAERQDIITDLSGIDARGVLVALPIDDQAELLGELPTEVARALLGQLDVGARDAVGVLLGFSQGSAGRHANPRFVEVSDDADVTEALAAVRLSTLAAEEVTCVFVVDDAGRYRGLVRLADLIRADGATDVAAIMDTDAPVATTTDDAASAGRVLQRHDLGAMAVVDADERLVGALVFDDAMDAIAADVSDTMLQKAGVADVLALKDRVRSERLIGGPILYPVRVRLLFLMVTLVGGLAVGGLIDSFEDTLGAVIAAAVFIPLVMDMGGNVGTQSTTIFARGLALGHIDLDRFRSFLFREVRVGMTMAIVLGVMGGTIAWAWQGAPNGIPELGIAVGVALVFSVTFASFLGFALPWVLVKLGADHAPGADPFITTIKDFTGLGVYFLLVSALIGT
jgi:magnesium transporter